MKAIVCEMCGSHDVVKQNEYYVCQACDTKYSTEAARKLMIEISGSVDVTGSTIKVDNTKTIENYITLANIAAEGKDHSTVVRYAEKILELDSNRYEAYLFMAKAAGWESSLNNPKLEKAVAYGKRAVALAENKTEVAEEIYMCLKCQVFALLHIALEMRAGTGEHVAEVMCAWVKLLTSIPSISAELIKKEYIEIAKLSNCKKTLAETNSFADRLPIFVSSGVSLYNNGIPYNDVVRNNLPAEMIVAAELDAVDTKMSETNEKPSGGCYVATCVYGSYDCPQVWTLRRYRDQILAETWYGRLFVRFYYMISPTLVRWFGTANWFKRLCKAPLDRIVENLHTSGIESSPYMDREW